MKNNKYVGADVHCATTSFCVRDVGGGVMMEALVETTGVNLLAFIKGVPGKVHLTFEEGTQAAWLYDLLRPHVAELVVCDPRKNKEEGNKSDGVDADRLSERLRLGSLTPVYHGEHGTRLLKELVCAHRDLVQEAVRAKSRIKARYRSRGITVRGADVYDRADRQQWLAKLVEHSGSRQRVEWLCEELDRVDELRGEAVKALVAESRKHRGCKLLRRVRGIGPIRAAQIVGQVDTPHRFRTDC